MIALAVLDAAASNSWKARKMGRFATMARKEWDKLSAGNRTEEGTSKDHNLSEDKSQDAQWSGSARESAGRFALVQGSSDAQKRQMKKSESCQNDARISIKECGFASEAMIEHKRCKDLWTENGEARCSSEEAQVPEPEEGKMHCGAKAAKVCDSGA